jgi:hypothetical protein
MNSISQGCDAKKKAQAAWEVLLGPEGRNRCLETFALRLPVATVTAATTTATATARSAATTAAARSTATAA